MCVFPFGVVIELVEAVVLVELFLLGHEELGPRSFACVVEGRIYLYPFLSALDDIPCVVVSLSFLSFVFHPGISADCIYVQTGLP